MGLRTRIERNRVFARPQSRAFRELVHAGADREVCRVDAARLLGVGMDVDQRTILVDQRRHRITVGRRLAEPRAHHQQQVGGFGPLDKLGVGTVTEVARIDRR